MKSVTFTVRAATKSSLSRLHTNTYRSINNRRAPREGRRSSPGQPGGRSAPCGPQWEGPGLSAQRHRYSHSLTPPVGRCTDIQSSSTSVISPVICWLERIWPEGFDLSFSFCLQVLWISLELKRTDWTFYLKHTAGKRGIHFRARASGTVFVWAALTWRFTLACKFWICSKCICCAAPEKEKE